MNILVINAGSSSLKYQLIDMTENSILAKGICERIGIGGIFKHSTSTGKEIVLDIDMKNHAEAIKIVVKYLLDKEYGVISDMNEISAVGHRVLHGGEKFSGSVLINDKVIEAIEECVELGPLHNPHNLTGIKACQSYMDVPQVAVFDTGFHQTMPKQAYMYALPYDYYEKYKIRRYGFHGTSHRYVSQRAAKFLNKDPKDGFKVITCHLGNGSSIAAVENGKCIDTSMGLTPLEGLLMGTRCGSIDPAIVTLLMEKENLTPKEMDDVMNKKSGVLAVSGVSSDFRDIEAEANKGNERCQLALKMFKYQICKYIGAYAAAMNGVDAIVFTAGIGENNSKMRKDIIEQVSFLGIKVDEQSNSVRGKEIEISTPDSKVKVLVIPTNEELTIALDTKEIVEGLKK